MTSPTLVAELLRSSIVATEAERKMATALADSATSGTPGAIDQLIELQARVADRETGRSRTLLPADPERSGEVISQITAAIGRMSAQLESELRSTHGRSWLSMAIICGVVSLFAALLPFGLYLTGSLGEQLPIGAQVIAVAAPLVGTVLCFRIYQVRDASSRRLREKRLALTFLEASLDIARSNPGASSLLEKSLVMFMTHYEAQDAPLSLSDMIPKVT